MYGTIKDFPNKKIDEGRNNQVKGYPLIIKQSSPRDGSYGNSPIVRVTFKTEKLRDKFLANFSKQFMENGTFRKIY